MKVSELIEFLQKQDQNLPVAYRIHSEQCMMELGDINVCELVAARPDGWIQNYRDDMPTQMYVLFPGN